MADLSSVPAWIPIVSAISGGIVVGVFGAINNYVNKKTEEKKLQFEETKHLREQIVNASLDYWYKHHELIKSSEGKLAMIVPFDVYLVHITAIMTEISNVKLTPESAPALLEKVHQISKAAYDQAKKDD
jgi:hypothetical protein